MDVWLKLYIYRKFRIEIENPNESKFSFMSTYNLNILVIDLVSHKTTLHPVFEKKMEMKIDEQTDVNWKEAEENIRINKR